MSQLVSYTANKYGQLPLFLEKNTHEKFRSHTLNFVKNNAYSFLKPVNGCLLWISAHYLLINKVMSRLSAFRFFLALILLPGFRAIVMAQHPAPPARINIDYDTRNLFIEVEGVRQGNPFRYSRQFQVKGLSDAEREDITNRILDSLGVSPSAQSTNPPTINQSTDEAVSVRCSSCTGKMRLDIVGNSVVFTREGDAKAGKNTLFPCLLHLKPGSYKLTYWQNRVLQIQQTFTVQSGQPNVITVK